MKKITENMKCPKCNSNNIKYISYIRGTKKSYIDNNKSIERIRTRFCTCNRCNFTFKKDYLEKYLMCNKLLGKNIKLIASFNSEDPNITNYELGLILDKEKHILIFRDKEYYIVISKKIADEIIYEINGLYNLDIEPEINKYLLLNKKI